MWARLCENPMKKISFCFFIWISFRKRRLSGQNLQNFDPEFTEWSEFAKIVIPNSLSGQFLAEMIPNYEPLDYLYH